MLSSGQIDWKGLTFNEYLALIPDEKEAYRFALQHGLVDTRQKCECGSLMALIGDASKASGLVFQCTAGRSVC
jgi:hypothetical protein